MGSILFCLIYRTRISICFKFPNSCILIKETMESFLIYRGKYFNITCDAHGFDYVLKMKHFTPNGLF